jgi:hypothetical protein
MDSTDLPSSVRELRARGLSPREIARTLGVRRADVEPLIRADAQVAAPSEPAVVGCWVSPGWADGLRWKRGRDSKDEHRRGERGLPSLVSVLVAREHRHGTVAVCGYLVDPHCLGVKNVIGPRVLDAHRFDEFRLVFFRAYVEEPERVPLALAQELVLGAIDYARRLGFEPHRDFEACRGHLGAWSAPGTIEFGHKGKPFFIQGPQDDAAAILRTLERTVGRGNFDFVVREA